MRSLFWLLVVFAAAVALVIVGRIDSGYVLLIYPPYRVEVSMLFFAIALVAGFALLYALIRVLGHTLSLPAYVRGYRARRRRERAHAALAAALQAYYEGRYSRAEKEAAVAFDGGSAPALAALLAARSAHQMRDFQRRDRWLDRADAQGERMHSASLATRAELALEDRDFATARDALRNLHSVRPKQIATTRMLLRAERGAGAWDEVLRLATQLGKRDAIAPALAEEYKVQAMIELLGRSARSSMRVVAICFGRTLCRLRSAATIPPPAHAPGSRAPFRPCRARWRDAPPPRRCADGHGLSPRCRASGARTHPRRPPSASVS